MAKLLVIYASDYGNTKKAAEVVAGGAKSVPGTEVVLLQAEKVKAEDALAADAIIVGSPVHMGSMDWRIKTFIDKVCGGLWMKDAMIGKVGAVFATGSGYGDTGGGAELTMLSMLNNFAELGMIIVPLPKNTPGYPKGGLQWGAYARSAGENLEQTGVSEDSLAAAKNHGANVARLAAALKGAKVFGG